MVKSFRHFIIIVELALLMSISIAHANPTLGGWYMGMQGGPQITSSKDSASGNGIINNNTVMGNGSSNLNKTGGMGGVFGGYGQMMRNWYVAAQGQVDLGNFQRTHTGSLNSIFSTNKLHTNALWGIATLIGYQTMKDIVGYVRLGGDFANWQYSDSLLGKRTSSQWAFAPGIGIRAMLTKNIFMNAEYKHSFFRKMTVSNNGVNANTKARIQAFTVGFAFKLQSYR